MTRRLVLTLAAAAATVAYFAVDANVAKAVLILAVSGGSAVAVVQGIRRHRPRSVGPWLLVAGGQILWTIAWALWEAPIVLDDHVPSAGSAGNLVFVAGNLLVAGALVVLVLMRE